MINFLTRVQGFRHPSPSGEGRSIFFSRHARKSQRDFLAQSSARPVRNYRIKNQGKKYLFPAIEGISNGVRSFAFRSHHARSPADGLEKNILRPFFNRARSLTGFTPFRENGIASRVSFAGIFVKIKNYLSHSLEALPMRRRNIMPFSHTGFTLIELLVVVSIIAMLLSIVFIRVTEVRAKARDASREERVRQIRNALDLYNVNRLRFPICTEEIVINGTTDCLSEALINDGVIQVSVSVDPLGGSIGVCGDPEDYVFCYESDGGFDYTLRYNLETNAINGKSPGWQTSGS